MYFFFDTVMCTHPASDFFLQSFLLLLIGFRTFNRLLPLSLYPCFVLFITALFRHFCCFPSFHVVSYFASLTVFPTRLSRFCFASQSHLSISLDSSTCFSFNSILMFISLSTCLKTLFCSFFLYFGPY